MSPTEIKLLALHRTLAVPLNTVAETYLGLGRMQAMRLAGLNRLPFPTMRMTDSRKAEYTVSVTDLAAYLDKRQADAEEAWKRSQT